MDTLELLKSDFKLFLQALWAQLDLPNPTRAQYAIADYLQHGPKRLQIQAFRGVGKSWITGAFVLWTLFNNSEKKDNGLAWEDPPASEAPFDNRFYWSRKTDGSLTEKSLTDINVVDKDGKEVIDPKTGKQMIQLGLKSIWITQTKQTC